MKQCVVESPEFGDYLKGIIEEEESRMSEQELARQTYLLEIEQYRKTLTQSVFLFINVFQEKGAGKKLQSWLDCHDIEYETRHDVIIAYPSEGKACFLLELDRVLSPRIHGTFDSVDMCISRNQLEKIDKCEKSWGSVYKDDYDIYESMIRQARVRCQTCCLVVRDDFD